ncbi:MAG: TIGR03643 family protein [Rubrivivax sp.]|nr:TIGR03643 family protein [Rubrivivax sp.]
MPKPARALDAADVSRVIEMTWEERTAFEAIETQFGLDEAAVIALMRQQPEPGSFRLWRDRAQGRKTKHAAMRPIALKGGYRHQARHRTPQR